MIIKNLKMSFIFVFVIILLSLLFNISVSKARSNESYLEVKKYLNDLKTLSADFIQISNDGAIRRGKIHITLPGKLRISYENPSDLLITSMGFWLVVQNRKLKQTNNYPLSKTPLNNFLNQKFDLDNSKYNMKFNNENGIITLKFLENEEMVGTSFQLFFNTNPVQLKKWEITDEFDNTTSVSFQNLITGIKHSHLLFFPEDFGEINND
tara:strand:- start:1887 stop:2513 length:627 start_codon:yes stop_codon:yes gene_type:complete